MATNTKKYMKYCSECKQEITPEYFPGRGQVCPDCLTPTLSPIYQKKEKQDLPAIEEDNTDWLEGFAQIHQLDGAD